MKLLQPTVGARHRYEWATPAEKKSIFYDLTRDQQLNQASYKKRFVQGANLHRPAHLRFAPGFHKENSLLLRSVFPEGLLKDEAGLFWIVKKRNPYPHQNLERREPRNSPRYERLAYLLAEGRANYAEIRTLDRKDYYLTRVTTAANTPITKLPHKRFSDAFAGIVVANIFMRKWDQHLHNFAYVGEIPVSIDHDMIGPPATFPHSSQGASTFHLAFLSFKLLTTLSFLRPELPVDTHSKTRLKYHFIRQNHSEAWRIMRDMLHGLGLAAGLIKAEGLETGALERSIVAFKNVANIEDLAAESGFSGPERLPIVRYLTQSQKTLGRDVAFFWQCLTGNPSRLANLD